MLPTAARAFGALLYISAEPGRQIPRAELQSLLYPGKDHADATHNLRQLLYKLRHFGVPIVARREAVALAARHVRADYTALLAPQTVTDEVLAAATGGFLSGYAPDFSAPFAHWVEEFKTRMGNAFCGTLMARLTSLRSEGRWRELEAVARACLGYDPLNEDATVALAQSLVVNGQRAGAARLLDEYLGELDSPRDATNNRRRRSEVRSSSNSRAISARCGRAVLAAGESEIV